MWIWPACEWVGTWHRSQFMDISQPWPQYLNKQGCTKTNRLDLCSLLERTLQGYRFIFGITTLMIKFQHQYLMTDFYSFISLKKKPHKHYTQLEKTNAWICEYRCNMKFIHAFYLNILNGMHKLVTLSVERCKSIP